MGGTLYQTANTAGRAFASPLTIFGDYVVGTGPTLLGVQFNSYDNKPNYIQNNITNLNAGAGASADWVATANTGTDLTGFVDFGINCSGFSSTTWTINGAMDGYCCCAGGNMAMGTDTAGKNLVIHTGGILLANSRAVFSDTQVLLQVPYSSTAKTVYDNTTVVTYTIPVGSDYVFLTTSAASLTVTYPAAAAAIDGREITFVTSATVGTAVLASAGATFVGAPAAFAANVPYRFKYHHATTKWYPC